MCSNVKFSFSLFYCLSILGYFILSRDQEHSETRLEETSWLHRASNNVETFLLPTDAHNVKKPLHSARHTRLTGHNMQP